MYVSKTSKREIIHGGIFDILQDLVLFPVFSGFEPATFRVLDEYRTSVPPNQEVKIAKILTGTS